jgi:ribosomal protein L9
MVGLQTELLDIVPVSPIGALFLQWYTRVRYVTDLPLVYTFGFMVVDKKMYDRISADDQAIMHEVMTRMYSEFDQTGPSDNEEALDAILDKGLKLVSVTDAEADEIRALMAEANRELAESGIVGIDLYEKMLERRDAFRLLDASERHEALQGKEFEVSTDGKKGVGSNDIASLLKPIDPDVSHGDIELPPGGILDPGEYMVAVRLHPVIDAQIVVRVVPAD